MLVSSSEDGATFKNTVGSLPDSGSEDDKGITTKARDNFSGNKDEGSYVNPLDDEELQRTIENSGDETKLSQYLINKASSIILDEQIPEGAESEDYKQFVRTEIRKNATEMAREYFEERTPMVKSILKYIREKRKEFISKYRGIIRDRKIKELSQKINELESLIRLSNMSRINTTTPPSTPPSEPLSMEGGRKKKRKKRTKRKSRKKYKKTKKYR